MTLEELWGDELAPIVATLDAAGDTATSVSLRTEQAIARCGCDTDGCATVYFTTQPVYAYSREVDVAGHVVVDLTGDDRLVGIEVLDRPDLAARIAGLPSR